MREGLNRVITKADLEFLKSLQDELLTQDTVAQRNPRFWVIMQTERIYNVNEDYADGKIWLYDEDSYEDNDEDLEELKSCLINDYAFFTEEDLRDIKSFPELKKYIDEETDYELREVCYSNREMIRENTFFLTQRECREHITRNYYHYNSTAHPYAMTAWRSPQVEKLFDILLNVDFEVLEGIISLAELSNKIKKFLAELVERFEEQKNEKK